MKRSVGVYSCGSRKLVTGRKTLVMGILNCTPDSFSDGGQYTDIDSCVRHALQMVEEGCDVIDIGGEATNPKVKPISAAEEIARIVPVINALRARVDIPLSVDTYKSETAKAALDCGIDIINDISGLLADPHMAEVAASYNAGVIVMFNLRTRGEIAGDSSQASIRTRLLSELTESVNTALAAGIKPESIMTDPGIGFGTTREQDNELTSMLEDISFGGKYPVLYAASRKRYVKSMIDSEVPSADDLDLVTAGLNVTAASLGASMVMTVWLC